MQYRLLGKRTGLKVSALGFGAMRLPMTADEKQVDRDLALPMLRRAFEGGVNYLDSAVGYLNEDSQRACGEALADWFRDHPRSSMVVSTKNPHYDKNDQATWWRNLENSLERMRVDYLDVYHHHSLNGQAFDEQVSGPDGLYHEMEKARDRGLIRHIAFSFHDTPEQLLRVIETQMFDSMTVQYNLISQTNAAAMARAHELGMGVVVMGPVGGGKLSVTSGPLGEALPKGVATTPELAIRFVLANPAVSVALSGMTRLTDVEQNLRAASRREPLSASEQAETVSAIGRLKKLAEMYCTGCRYCEPCPQGVRIADIFAHLIIHEVYGAQQRARDGYAFMARANGQTGKKLAEGCIECGVCETKCPQKIKIIEQLKKTRRLLEQA